MSAPNPSTDAMQPPASGPARVLRSRSRPPSRARLSDPSIPSAADQASGSNTKPEDISSSSQASASTKEPGSTPYSRSPELRISHKLAERKRRKEMKDLFDELRDQLPADRGMKASKWEILSKGALACSLYSVGVYTHSLCAPAVDFIVTLKQNHQEMGREIEMLRHELDSMRQGIPHFVPPHPIVYGHAPAPPVHPYVPPGGPPGPAPQPPQPSPAPPSHQPQQQPGSRPGSSQNAYPPNTSSPVPAHNGNGNGIGVEAPHTETPS